MILLDSNALYWWMVDPGHLSPKAVEAVAGANGLVHVSVASIWELEIKRAAGRLDLPDGVWDLFDVEDFSILSIGMSDALAAARLPKIHGDPFDRMIIAQARLRGLTVVTRDRSFEPYGIPIIEA